MSKPAGVERLPIVLDCGSYQTRAGFGGEDAPRSEFATVVGRPSYPGQNARDVYVGEQALSMRFQVRNMCPIERGRVMSWDDMEQLWKFCLEEELKVIVPSEHSVVLTWNCIDTASSNQNAVEIMFEKMNISALYIESPSVLSLYSFGRTSGCVVDSGHGMTSIVPIYEGFRMPQANRRTNLGGLDVTKYLTDLLNSHGYAFHGTSDKEVVRDIKEKLAYVALNPSHSEEADSARYELPDGSVIEMCEERHQCVEALFQPRLAQPANWEAPGLPQAIHDSIQQCDLDVRRALWSSILLTGGNTLFPGLGARLKAELTALVPGNVSVQVTGSPHRQCSAWVGGAMLATMSGFQQKWVSKAEYDEQGVYVARRKWGD